MYRWRRGDDWQARGSCAKNQSRRPPPPPVPFQHAVFWQTEAFAANDIAPGLREVMNTAVTIVNVVKARATNCRLSPNSVKKWALTTTPCSCTQSEMFFSLREKLCSFLSDKRPNLAEYLCDEKWLAQLSYLADIFIETNKLNETMLEKRPLPSMNESKHSKEN